MYDLDHMLNGRGSRNHHQRMIDEVQRQRFDEETLRENQKRKRLPQRLGRIISAIVLAQLFVK